MREPYEGQRNKQQWRHETNTETQRAIEIQASTVRRMHYTPCIVSFAHLRCGMCRGALGCHRSNMQQGCKDVYSFESCRWTGGLLDRPRYELL